MTVVSRSAVVPYSASEMYALVNDIESYPRFLPWCRAAHIESRDDRETIATLEIARSGLHKSFTTRNRAVADREIRIQLVRGPFRHLEGVWRFEDQDRGSRVTLDMEFEFSNRLVSMAFGSIFHQIASSLVDAFCRRAVDVYGRRD